MEPVEPLRVRTTDALDARDDGLALERSGVAAALHAYLEAGGEGGDARGGLSEKLVTVGQHEAGRGVGALELVHPGMRKTVVLPQPVAMTTMTRFRPRSLAARIEASAFCW